MGYAHGMLPRVHDFMDDAIQTHAVFYLGKNKGTMPAHFQGVALHHFQIGTHPGRKVGFVDYQQIALGDSRAAFARDFIPATDIDHLDGEICQFAAETRRQIIPAGFDEQDVRLKFGV